MNYLLIYFKGMLMGMADLVPGVSGGTIALITGIYERLINAIAAANLKALKMVFKGQINQAWQQVDGWFLITLLFGMLSAIFFFATLIKYLLTTQPVLTWSFFFGLIVSSAALLLNKNRSVNMVNWLTLVFGVFLGYILSTQSMAILPAGSLGVFIAGMIAISAMILPGISGSLILILLGMYQYILAAVENRDWMVLMIFASGCLIGLMVFSRLLKWLLARFYQATIYALAGLMLGTLFKVWPWKDNSHNLMPFEHPEPHIFWALGLMALATILVMVLFKMDKES